MEIKSRFELNAGQVWSLHNSSEYFLLVLGYEKVDSIHILHVSVLDSENDILIEHVPFTLDAVCKSISELNYTLIDVHNFSEGYSIWKREYESGKAGVFSVDVTEVI